ncbi:hypothetical protein [Rhizobium ruizarguesonis]|uniref:hypothetical protein n=1 Tax=Rhizobium ruizarguesonis TaxID=2081791 RepID=UPI001030CD40|nr:hypothetical protein [Rhizobium ruizarguesonis]TBD75923.1 hypothetical protein ELH13_26795 [Rhizobium ruizarguesonis]
MKHLFAAALSALVISTASTAFAQSMSGVSVGGDRQQLDSIGSRPVATQAMGPHTIEKYKLSGGNELSVTYHRASGKIVYLETDWGGETAGAFSDFEGFKFGKTTLSEIRTRLRSNGISFKARPPVTPTPDGGLALFNSFEINGSGTIATFVTSVSAVTVTSIKEKGLNPNIGDVAKLQAVIVGERDYLETIWGSDKTKSPNYSAIDWPGNGSDQAPKSPQAAFTKPEAADFPVERVYRGLTVKPDFSGSNAHFRDFRTRIREGMAGGPGFAGEFSVIRFGCGTGCSAVIVASNKTGQPYSFPRGGEDNMYLTLKYQLDSRLMVAQWGSYDSGECFMEYFDFANGIWSEIAKREIGPLDACYKDIEENGP